VRAFAFLEGSVLHREGRYDEVLAVLAQAVGPQTSNLPSLHLKMGEVCVAKRDWRGAGEHYAEVIGLDSLDAQAHYGLARVAFHERDWQRAATEALTAAGQRYQFPQAHYIAGIALWRQGKTDAALTSLHACCCTCCPRG
jgi:tetratricopeptide (TPR) repeat protein